MGHSWHMPRMRLLALVNSSGACLFELWFSQGISGEGNGTPLQCSCLENPRDGGAWWAAVCGVAQSDTTEATQQQQQQGTCPGLG